VVDVFVLGLYVVVLFLDRQGIEMRVEKAKFDAALVRLLKAKPEPRKNIKVAKRKPAKIIQPTQ